MMRKILTQALIAAFCVIAASTAWAQTIGGRYAVRGTNPDGSSYGGTAEIIMANDGTCRILWNTGDSFNGTCIISGQALNAVYQSGSGSGTANYQVQPDGTLRGTWTMGDGNGTEILIPAR